MSATRPPFVRVYSCRSNYDGSDKTHAVCAPLACVYVQRFMQETKTCKCKKQTRSSGCMCRYIRAGHACIYTCTCRQRTGIGCQDLGAVTGLCTCICAHIQAIHPCIIKIQVRRRTSLHPLLQQLHAIKLMTYHDDATEEVRGDSSDTNHTSAIMMTPRRVRHRQGERRRQAWLIF